MMRTVLTGLAVAGLLGGKVQAGTVLDEPDDSALGWWSGGAGDEGIGSAPLPAPVADCGDWTPRRGSLYGAICRTPPHRVVVPPAYWPASGMQFPTGGSIGVLSGGGSVPAPEGDGLTILPPPDAVDTPAAVQGANGELSLGGTSFQFGSSAFLAGGDWMGGALTFSGGGVTLLSDLNTFSLSLVNFSSGDLADGYGNLWTVGPDGTLSSVVNTLSPVPEPGSLAMAGFGFFLTAWLVRKRRRRAIIWPGAPGEN